VESDDWSGEIEEWEISMSEGEAVPEFLTAPDFLKQYPPYFYNSEGGAIAGGYKLELATDLTKFNPQDHLAESPIDWSQFPEARGNEVPSWYTSDTLREQPASNFWNNGSLESVHEVLAQHLCDQAENSDEQILFYDQNSGEIADIIEFDLQNQTVTFYHCKSGDEPGTSLSEIRDVQEQVLRTVRYLRTTELLDRIETRNGGSTNQHFISGEDKFDRLDSEFQPNQWEHTVSIVHPGLDLDIDMTDHSGGGRNIGILLCVCYEWLADENAKLEIHPGSTID
jgi:hypothetical protein